MVFNIIVEIVKSNFVSYNLQKYVEKLKAIGFMLVLSRYTVKRLEL